MVRIRPLIAAAATIALAGCASQPKIAVTPPPVMMAPPVRAAMPEGGYPGMAIPAMLADGSYQTPNRALSAAAATWHLRAALNVAALACRRPEDAGLVDRYNAMLTAQKTALASAQTALAAEYRAGGGDWQDRYDDAMTRLYNYFSQSFVRDRFCAAAAQTLGEVATVEPAAFATFASQHLASLDRPFTDFYRAYDAWRTAQMPVQQMAMAPRMQPVIATVATPATVVAEPKAAPRLEIDLSNLGD
ncbi:conserved exported hypothetical protein [Sphingomonas sp. EC-HK361]|uniref:hypothetical protein n=1 Tax=Sphingomonas sp. EC-HK361 TaxID=2038397 RepID=UPI00125A2944|nr:hypothetical protein [Sphingomonas sp. EC-HK361]VVT13807.1 conserved exported hypothetical protein [Sphingomonas sp. EC-HK361]